MDNVCISILISYTDFAFENVAKVQVFRAQNNQIPGIPIFDKKVKGIVYSDKSTLSFFPPHLKSCSPNQRKPRRQNAMYSDLSTKLSTNPESAKKRTIKNLFWVLPRDTSFLRLVWYHLYIESI